MAFSWSYLNVNVGDYINNESLNELYSNVHTLRTRFGLSAISSNYTDEKILATYLTNLRGYFDEMSGKTPLSECTAHYTTHLSTHNSTYDSTKYVTHLGAHYTTHLSTHYSSYNSTRYVTHLGSHYTSYCGSHYASYVGTHNVSHLSSYNGTYKANHYASYNGLAVSGDG